MNDDLTGGIVDRQVGQIRAYLDKIDTGSATMRLLFEYLSWLLRWQAKLTAAIRSHRDARGDDRCWRDDDDLYSVLPEGYQPPKRDTLVELERCKAFIASRQHPGTDYVSPQREIDSLTKRLDAILEIANGNTPHASDYGRLMAISRLADKGLEFE